MGEIPAVCLRLRETRVQCYGTRGRSAFARELGLAASTYTHYENDRPPPADVLLKASRLTRVRLEWLITGEGPAADLKEIPPRHGDVLQRVAALLDRRPDLCDSVNQVVDVLGDVVGSSPAMSHLRTPSRAAWIPVIGSTAAGAARFWAELPGRNGVPVVDARLSDVVALASARSATAAEGDWKLSPGDSVPMLIQCSDPDESGLLEFVAAESLKRRFPAAVAWRIDGDSMAPRYQDGDFVIVDPESSVPDGCPCVIRQRGQIGVNCKLIRRDRDEIQLIPINECRPTQRIPGERMEWAHRVVGKLRLRR